jgi:serine phosphatase RsbU (regulator of sigma subunit)
MLYSAGGGLLLILVFSGLLYNRFRVTRKQRDIIEEQKETVELQKATVEEQKQLVEAKNKAITASINYAQKIQSAILQADDELKQIGRDNYFILFKPKEAVSGDFYWAYHNKGELIWTAADCTGHGVPGAFMSMIGNRLLNEVVIERQITDPGEVLNQLRAGIIDTLQQKGEEEEMRDGMDMALCKMQTENSALQVRYVEFSGAKNPLYIVAPNIVNRKVAQKADKIHGSDLIEIAGDKQPIGYEQEEHQPFTKHQLELQKGDLLYTFSDGYPDQFGGPKGKKFLYKRFKQLLIDIQDRPMDEQKEILNKTIEDWMSQNDEEQIDDICILGVKVT